MDTRKPQNSALREQFESEFQRGELDDLSQFALPFFLNNLDELRAFITDYHSKFGEEDLNLLLKLYILNKNMPFDMGMYMRIQRCYIEENLQKTHGELSEVAGVSRQEAVSDWIRNHAQQHRQQAILKQVFCFDKIAERLLPEIRKILDEQKKANQAAGSSPSPA